MNVNTDVLRFFMTTQCNASDCIEFSNDRCLDGYPSQSSVSHEGRDLIIYRSGLVDVHGVASEAEAIEFIDVIKFIVEGAFID